MIVVMKPDATEEQIEHMDSTSPSLGLTPAGHRRAAPDGHRRASARSAPGLTEALGAGEGVEKVLPIMAPYKRASSELKRERTVVRRSVLEVGGKQDRA